jgi:hypothetical protein
MARNGYTSSDADTLALQELTAIGLRAAPGSGPGTIVPGSGPTAAQNKAQIATAVTDADCTQAADLAGIYFAVQASYEQQVADANQQALNAAVLVQGRLRQGAEQAPRAAADNVGHT